MSNLYFVGTRSSPLALYQAHFLKNKLKEIGILSELKTIKTTGDINLTKPIYEIGIEGVFTKALDEALLNNQIDMAIHSMKDIPTRLPKGLIIAAVLKRHTHKDILIIKNKSNINDKNFTLATSSIRRKAQWLAKYPSHSVEPIRGNIQTRLEKFEKGNFDGLILAEAALKRLQINLKNTTPLDWMISAPAQGALAVVVREKDMDLVSHLKNINCNDAFLTTKIERDFMRTLEGGCSAPIGAFAEITDSNIKFKGIYFTKNNSQKQIVKTVPKNAANQLGIIAANEILNS